MKGAKDEEKLISPMFPRLHVNDTEKGGPRAPPRNKMALYEQLSIPSQRFISGSSSLLPLPPNHASSLVSSKSMSHGGVYERSIFTPFCNSPATSHLGEKHSSFSSEGVRLSTMMGSQQQKSINTTKDRSLNTLKPLSLSAKSSPYQLHKFSSFKKFGDENDFRVPMSVQTEAAVHCSSSRHSKDQETSPHLSLTFSMQFQNDSEKQKNVIDTIHVKAKECSRNQTEENAKVSQTDQDPMKRCSSIPSIKDKTSVDESPSLLVKVKNTETLKRLHPSSNKGWRRRSMDASKSSHVANTQSSQEFVFMQKKTVLREKLMGKSAGDTCKGNTLNVRSESYLRPSHGDDNRKLARLENVSIHREDNLPAQDVERHDDVSENSVVDSMSDVTPTDVVRVIGDKQFWKARKAIVDQQRVFAVQVFELHRLIKVQKLIAESPDFLIEDNLYVGRATLKVSPIKNLPPDCPVEPPPTIVKPKENSQKPRLSIEFADENAMGKIPLPSVNNETSKEHSTQRSDSGNALLTPISTSAKSSPWCFPPPASQCLVPFMSPSEGLVFKPYTGPCPPAAGFMAPVYSNCSPMSLTPGGGDFLNAAYGVLPVHQQGIGILPETPPLGPTYFPPCGMPFIKQSVSCSADEQISPFSGSHSKDPQISVGDINFILSHQTSVNMSSQMSQAVSCHAEIFQASKGSEIQGSTASSPLPLFPMEPTVQASDQNVQTNEQPTRVIKVVPHNPRSATESAARIFRSIQQERKQYVKFVQTVTK